MRKNAKISTSSIWEKAGLDWLPVIWNESKYFPYAPLPSKEEIEDINKQTGEMSEDVIDEVVDQFEIINKENQVRWVYAENKASALLSLTGLGTTFTFGISQFSFLMNDAVLVPWIVGFIVLLYILIVVSLLITITLVRRVMSIAAASSPNPSHFLGLREWNRLLTKQCYAASLLISYRYNDSSIRDKITYLIGAEKWFGITISLLPVLLLVVGIGLVAPSMQIVFDGSGLDSVTSPLRDVMNASPSLTITQSTVPNSLNLGLSISTTMTQSQISPIISPIMVLTRTTTVTP